VFDRTYRLQNRRARSREKLSLTALAFRFAHAAIAAGFLLAIAYLWWCALTGRRGALLRVAIAALAGEGLLVVANRGDCPLGGMQRRLGDPVPLFELVLSPQAARRAVPVLGIVTVAGVAVLARLRGRALAHRPSSPCHPWAWQGESRCAGVFSSNPA
jgi:hypothetical protein